MSTPTIHHPATAVAPRRGRRLALGPPALVGIAYSLSWLAGLTVWSSSTRLRATGAEVVAATTGHEGVAAVQYLLTEGLPAVGLAVVALALARSARHADRLARVVAATGLAAAAVSLSQFVLGLSLTEAAVPDGRVAAAGSLSEAITRLDGVKMLLLAVLAAAAAALIRRGRVPLPRWIGWVATALAATIALSGVSYLLLLGGLGQAAYLSLPLLLVWVTGTLVLLPRRAR